MILSKSLNEYIDYFNQKYCLFDKNEELLYGFIQVNWIVKILNCNLCEISNLLSLQNSKIPFNKTQLIHFIQAIFAKTNFRDDIIDRIIND